MDSSSIQPLLDWLNQHQSWTAAAIFVIAFLESLALAGVVIPGVLLLFGASAIAGNGNLGIWLSLGCAFAGAVVGDGSSFFLGKYFKEHIKELWPFRRYPGWIENGELFFDRHGGKSIIIGRFVGPIRPVMPLVAGMLGMPAIRYISANLVSALAWAPVYVLPGFMFGASIENSDYLPEGIGQLTIYSLVIIGCGYLVAKLSHWHLSKDSTFYRVLHTWVERQQNVRLCWYWLSNPRERHTGFPLPSLMLMLASLFAFVFLSTNINTSSWLQNLDRQAQNFFSFINHPFLDGIFNFIAQLSDSRLLFLLEGILLFWLLIKRYLAATITCSVAIFLSSLLLYLFRESPVGLLSRLSENIIHITLLFGLSSAFIAREINHSDRWWIYGSALVPITLAVIASLYLNDRVLTVAIASIFYGLIFCGLCRFVYSRYDSRAIKADLSFYSALGICLITIILFRFWA